VRINNDRRKMRLVGVLQVSFSWATVHGTDHFGFIKYAEFNNNLNGC